MNKTVLLLLFSGYIIWVLPFSTAVEKEPTGDWTQLVIPSAERSFDFQTVTKGMRPEYTFILKNPFQEPIHVAAIISSCTCTNAIHDQNTEIPTYGEFAVTAQFQGDLFDGLKNATLTVVIDKPNRSEILLNVRGDIRADVKVVPDTASFGDVPLGEERLRELTITCDAAKRWQIVDVKSPSPFIKTELTGGEVQNGRKKFVVKIVLDKAAPQGILEERIVLVGNDAAGNREIPIRVRATVGTVIKVTPPTLFLGTQPPGVPTQKKMVVLRGSKPFRITKIECDNPAVEIPFTADKDAAAKVLYTLPVCYKNPKEGAGAPKEGVVQTQVRISTDEPALTPSFYVTMRVQEELAP